MRAMAQPEISIINLYRSFIPFDSVLMVMMVTMILFPELALWLPNHVYGK